MEINEKQFIYELSGFGMTSTEGALLFIHNFENGETKVHLIEKTIDEIPAYVYGPNSIDEPMSVFEITYGKFDEKMVERCQLFNRI